MENVLIKVGQKNNKSQVRRLQVVLNTIPTGEYDSHTEELVKHWQESNKLKVDGIVGNITWDKLVIPYEKYLTDQVSISSFPLDISGLKYQVPYMVYKDIPLLVNYFRLSSPQQLALFLGQCAHESGNFTITEENLNYSAEGLIKTFPRKFGSIAHAEQYEHQPEKIANYVYASINGNENEASGDGWKYRGRGYIQLTGRYNYDVIGKRIAVDLLHHPELVEGQYALLTSGQFFDMRSLWDINPSKITDADIVKVTKKVNPGLLGLQERIKYTNHFSQLLGL